MSVDDEMKEAILAVAKAKVAESLGGDVLGRLVNEVMNHTDRRHGGSERLFDKIVRECIEGEIRKAVASEISSNQSVADTLREAVRAKADTFTASVIDAFASDDWRASLNVTINRPD